MRRIFCHSVLFFLLVAATDASSEELFRDLSLEQGFRLSAVASSLTPVEVGTILASAPAPEPVWRLAQWGTRFDLLKAEVELRSDGTRRMQNEGKSITVHSGGLGGEGVTLAVHGGAEYDGKLRRQGEPWPHLLVEQVLADKLRPADFKSLKFNVAFRVDQCRNVADSPLDPGLHTAHITAFWTLHNRNPDSEDFGDMIWFGLPLFDARHDVPSGHQAVDRGKDDASGKFICTLEGSRFFDGPTGDGNWHTLAGDLVPLIGEALAASQEKGFLKATRFEDLQATSFNLGWEVPGPYDCSITLKDLSLQGR